MKKSQLIFSGWLRRAQDLKIDLGRIDSGKPVHMVIDATGLKVYGEGEWHMRAHGKSRRRTWRNV